MKIYDNLTRDSLCKLAPGDALKFQSLRSVQFVFAVSDYDPPHACQAVWFIQITNHGAAKLHIERYIKCDR